MDAFARVTKSPDGWVATLAGGSATKPFPEWAAAYDYALRHTVLFRAYWAQR